MPQVDLDESFEDAINRIPEEGRREIGAIIRMLQEDPWFRPDEREYKIVVSPDHDRCGCRRDDLWCGWIMYWEYERDTGTIDPNRSITKITVMLRYEPAETLMPRWKPE